MTFCQSSLPTISSWTFSFPKVSRERREKSSITWDCKGSRKLVMWVCKVTRMYFSYVKTWTQAYRPNNQTKHYRKFYWSDLFLYCPIEKTGSTNWHQRMANLRPRPRIKVFYPDHMFQKEWVNQENVMMCCSKTVATVSANNTVLHSSFIYCMYCTVVQFLWEHM